MILAVLGAVHCFARNNGTARVMLEERAVTLDPNSAWAWSRLGWVENYSDRPERAIPTFERALRLSPLYPVNLNNYRDSVRWIRRNIVSALAGSGRVDEAAAELERLRADYPELTVTKFKAAMVFSAATLDRMGENLKRAGLSE